MSLIFDLHVFDHFDHFDPLFLPPLSSFCNYKGTPNPSWACFFCVFQPCFRVLFCWKYVWGLGLERFSANFAILGISSEFGKKFGGYF
jgi:hypothetical protein